MSPSTKIIFLTSNTPPPRTANDDAAPHGSTSPPTPSLPARNVTFERAFLLPGMDSPHAPGTYAIVDTRESLDVMWDAYRTSLQIMLTGRGITEALEVTSVDLSAALARDAGGVT